MKVLLFTGYGESAYTKRMLEAAKSQTGRLADRTGKVVEIVEQAEVIKVTKENENDIFEELKNRLKKDTELILGVEFSNLNEEYCKFIRYYIWDPDIKWVVEMAIIDVDTSKPWKIIDYDGAESIEYFQGVKILDQETNYAEW